MHKNCSFCFYYSQIKTSQMKKEKKPFDHLIIQRSLNFRTVGAALIFFLLLATTSCQKSETIAPSTSSGQTSFDQKLSHENNFKQVNLVSDVAEYNPQHIDPNLVNAWGLAFTRFGSICCGLYSATSDTRFTCLKLFS